jgi:hypothetical protein
MFLISMFSCARLVIASAARRATPPLPWRPPPPAAAAAAAGPPAPPPSPPVAVLAAAAAWRGAGLLMLWAASSFTRPVACVAVRVGVGGVLRQCVRQRRAHTHVAHGGWRVRLLLCFLVCVCVCVWW